MGDGLEQNVLVAEHIHQGVDHNSTRNYVHWDITTVCNYGCSYCYAMREYKDDWNKEIDITTIQSIIRAINLSTLPVFLGLLGGEPTLSKHFFTILEYLKNEFFIREGDRVYITTNLSRDSQWFIAFPNAQEFKGNLFFLVSWHAKEASLDPFINNINILRQKGYKVKVNVMIDPDCTTWGITKTLLLSLQKLQRTKGHQDYGELIIHPHFVYINEHELYDYPINLNLYFGETIANIPKEFSRDGVLYNDLEIFTSGLNDFKGWNCYLNNYEINLFGDVNKFCVQEKDNLIENPLYFRAIKETKPIICPHKACTCDGLLKVRKEINATNES